MHISIIATNSIIISKLYEMLYVIGVITADTTAVQVLAGPKTFTGQIIIKGDKSTNPEVSRIYELEFEYIECPECESLHIVNLNEQRLSYTTYKKCKICGDTYEDNFVDTTYFPKITNTLFIFLIPKNIAKKLGYVHLDTGAMYRAITLKALRLGIDMEDENAYSFLNQTELDICNGRFIMDGEDVSESIRTVEVTENVSTPSKIGVVRTLEFSLMILKYFSSTSVGKKSFGKENRNKSYLGDSDKGINNTSLFYIYTLCIIIRIYSLWFKYLFLYSLFLYRCRYGTNDSGRLRYRII